jgi:hypothetical protein
MLEVQARLCCSFRLPRGSYFNRQCWGHTNELIKINRIPYLAMEDASIRVRERIIRYEAGYLAENDEPPTFKLLQLPLNLPHNFRMPCFVIGRYYDFPLDQLLMKAVPALGAKQELIDQHLGTGEQGCGAHAAGMKIKAVKGLVLQANLLFRMNGTGLRANVVPLFGVSYSR